jgi:hypothetical protein
MITGKRDDISILGSYVLPTENGDYNCPPALVVEVFWKYRMTESGDIMVDEYGNDSVLMFNVVDPVTFNYRSKEAKPVTAEMVGKWIPTKFHPHFIGGRM